MYVHFYDYLNKNKIAKVHASAFSSIQINHNIDDFSSCTLVHTLNPELNSLEIRGFENVYIEDDNGNIIFGGILTAFNINANSTTITLYDHRWVLSRLVLDASIDITSADQILDVVELLLNSAKSKRQIPLEFDRESSAINPTYSADLHFEIGDDIASCLQKIIQTVYARWAVRYFISGNEIYGSLRVRSVRGVTPEGVGISRSFFQSEDGEVVTLLYAEGGNFNTIQEFAVVYDLSSYTSRTKVGTKMEGTAEFVTAPPDPTSFNYEYFFGRAEGFITDYRANSADTANALSIINQTYPRLDIDVLLTPDFDMPLATGDRVGVRIESPMITGLNDNSARIDSISYTYKGGLLERRMLVNFMSPQKRSGVVGLLQALSQIQQRLDGLDKSYLNS